jgi:hypothetical protein
VLSKAFARAPAIRRSGSPIGTLGRVLAGELRVLDEEIHRRRPARPALIGESIRVFQDPVKTAEARSPDGMLCTVGDGGYLYLTDRRTFMIGRAGPFCRLGEDLGKCPCSLVASLGICVER